MLDRLGAGRRDQMEPGRKARLVDSSETSGASLVLVVDDYPELRRVTARWLRREGFDVEEAASGEDALALLSGRTPRAVLLDVEMPGLGGLATLDEMLRRRPGLPVVMLSGHADDETARALRARGAAGFLSKPFDRGALIAAVREAWTGALRSERPAST